MLKFCRKCQCETERYKDGKCRPCKAASNAAYNSNPEHKAKQVVIDLLKPCVKCSKTDRYPSGRCRPCILKNKADYYMTKTMNGECRSCPNLPVFGKIYCIECSTKRSVSRIKNRKTKDDYNAKVENKARQYDLALQRNYGITHTDKEAMLTAQGGKCKICHATEPGRAYKNFDVDHQHFPKDIWKAMPPEEKRKYIRGLLCHNCNIMLGMSKDNATNLRLGAEYLETYYGFT